MASTASCKVVVFGSGAIGLHYGLRLLEAELAHPEAGLQVSFMMRRDLQLVSQAGIALQVEDRETIHFPAEQFAGRLYNDVAQLVEARGKADWVFLCMKSYALKALQHQLLALCHSHTKIVVIMNGLGMEDTIASWLGPSRVFGGIAYIAVSRADPDPDDPSNGPLLVTVKKELDLHIGHMLDDAEQLKASAALWAWTRIAEQVVQVPALLTARWSKVCWNIAFSGIAVAMGGLTTDLICDDPGLSQLADEVLTECINVGNADISHQHTLRTGLPCPAELLMDMEAHKAKLWMGSRKVGAYRTSTVLDLLAGREMEMEYLFSEVLRRARCLGEVDPMLRYSKLEAVVLMVEATGRIAAAAGTERKMR